MGDYPSAGPEGASGGGRSGRREDVFQTVQSPATVQSEDEGYDTLMPVVSNALPAMYRFVSVAKVNTISWTICCLNETENERSVQVDWTLKS